MRKILRELLIGLAAAGVVILLWQQNNLLPLLLLAGLFIFLFRFSNLKSPRLGAIGKKKVSRSRVEFNRIGGQEQAKKELLEALEF
ncbi:MAG: ATPase, partial [Firmicutes bacterium]|nr:ATPase [Bacillota bacterium]